MRSPAKIRERRLPVAEQSRRAFCGSVVRFSAALAFFPLAELLASCGVPQVPQQQKKKILRPPVQINNTDVIPSTRYLGEAFLYPQQMVFVSLEPMQHRLPGYAQGISFLGIIAQDTLSVGYDTVNPRDVALLGMFKQQNGTFRYGYEINGVRQYVRGHIQGSDYNYVIDFSLNEEGLVKDPDHPGQRRFGYDFQISSGSDASTRLHGLQSSPIFANQIFVGVMDENNAVHLPSNKQIQLYIGVSGSEQVPGVIYKNDDDTNQLSSQYSDSQNRIILTLSSSS